MNTLLLAVLLTATAQDAETKTLLRLEDAWASALVKRDAPVFERLLAPGFIYTENDPMMGPAAAIHSVVAGARTTPAARQHPAGVAPRGSRRRPRPRGGGGGGARGA